MPQIPIGSDLSNVFIFDNWFVSLFYLYFPLFKDSNPLIWCEQTGPVGGKGEEKKPGRSKQRRNRKDKPARSGTTHLQILNLILHTAWLNNHALTLKRNTTKYYFGFFAYLPKNLLWIKENLCLCQRLFNFNATSVLKKYILMYGKHAMACFKCQGVWSCMVQKPSHMWMLSFGW